MRLFPNTKLRKYPRMTTSDALIWEDFLKLYGKDYDNFAYDVKVGEGVVSSEEIDSRYVKDFQELTKKRIDAVGFSKEGITIFEVKPRAGTYALGQLLSYRQLYLGDNPGANIKYLAVVTRLMTDEEKKIYASNGILTFVFPSS